MNTDVALFWLQEALQTGLVVIGPLLGAALAIGVLVSLFQAVTSMQEMTLSFIPKLLVIAAVFFFLVPWMLQMMADFTVQIFSAIPSISQ
jgi:flagellar biosynthetic protein FliQ